MATIKSGVLSLNKRDKQAVEIVVEIAERVAAVGIVPTAWQTYVQNQAKVRHGIEVIKFIINNS